MGSRALLARALSHARTEHAALNEVSVSRRANVALEGVARASEAHGEWSVVAGLETVLGALLALLARLIGVDMVARLVAQSVPIGMADEDRRSIPTAHTSHRNANGGTSSAGPGRRVV
jgi:hypothetical protein